LNSNGGGRGIRTSEVWRTGGSLDEVIDEAHLSASHILAGIERFVSERDQRRAKLSVVMEAIQGR
jgi:hypothetical protein